jgi:hypothetical protein
MANNGVIPLRPGFIAKLCPKTQKGIQGVSLRLAQLQSVDENDEGTAMGGSTAKIICQGPLGS